MYIVHYTSGAVTWTENANLKIYVNLIALGAVSSLIDVKSKRALFLNKERKVLWGEIQEETLPSDEEMKSLEEPVEKEE